MLARELACACLGWGLAGALWVGASRLPRSLLSDEFGADGLPRGLAMLLFAVATLIALRALWARRAARPAGAPQAPAESPRNHARALGIVALGCGYVLLAPWIGYPPAAAVLVFSTAVYYGARPNPTLALVSVAGALFLWWMFARMLSVSMPTGTLWKLLG